VKISILPLCLLSLCIRLNGRESALVDMPQIKIGNLALPSSQQPGPLLGFGQNIIDKHTLQLFMYADWFIGHQQLFAEVIPSVLYAFRDDLSLLIEWPFAARFHIGSQHSSGPEDLFVQFEYALYNQERLTATNQITLVAALVLPTGSIRKTPPTGFGSPSFFIGMTASHMATDWYYYVSPFVLLTTSHHKRKIGNQFVYQAGIGKNIAYKSDEWLCTWMLELSGTYSQSSRVNGLVVWSAFFERNIILIGPSLWFSTKNFIAQLGIAPIVASRVVSKEFQDLVYIACNFGWTF
jgi:hypothetical protein